MTAEIDALADRASALIQVDRDAEAVALVREGLRSEPRHPRLLLLLASGLVALDINEALPAADAAVSADPSNARAVALRGWILHHVGDRTAGDDVLRQAVAMDPTDAFARRLLSSALLGSASKQHAVYRKAARRKLLDEAQVHVLVLQELAPEVASSHNVAAHLRLLQNEPVLARGALDAALAIDPNDARSHQLLGVVAEVQGDLGRAGDHYLESARLDPRSRGGMDRLRGLSAGAGISGVALYFGFRVAVGVGASAGATIGRVLVALAGIAVVFALVVLPWLRTRRDLSPEARAALARDRSLRGRSVPWALVVKTGFVIGVTVLAVVALPSRYDDPERPPIPTIDLSDLTTTQPP